MHSLTLNLDELFPDVAPASIRLNSRRRGLATLFVGKIIARAMPVDHDRSLRRIEFVISEHGRTLPDRQIIRSHFQVEIALIATKGLDARPPNTIVTPGDVRPVRNIGVHLKKAMEGLLVKYDLHMSRIDMADMKLNEFMALLQPDTKRFFRHSENGVWLTRAERFRERFALPPPPPHLSARLAA